MDRKLFSGNKRVSETNRKSQETSEPCPKCGAALRILHSGKESFLGCSAFPTCSYTRSLHEKTDFEPQPLPGQYCPDCGEDLLLKKGKYGFFVGCSSFPACHYMLDPNAPAEQQAPTCPSCQQGQLVLRTSKFGKSFYACDAYPKCKYSLQEEPVAQPCPRCGWGIMTKHKLHGRESLRCPQKECGYKQESV